MTQQKPRQARIRIKVDNVELEAEGELGQVVDWYRDFRELAKELATILAQKGQK